MGRTAPVVSSRPVSKWRNREVCCAWSRLPAHLHPPVGSEICVRLLNSGCCTPAPPGLANPHASPGCSQPLQPAWHEAGGGRGFVAGKNIPMGLLWLPLTFGAKHLGILPIIYNYDFFSAFSYSLLSFGLSPLKLHSLISSCPAYICFDAK